MWRGIPEQRVALVGLGQEDKITVEKLRRAFGALTKACNAKKWQSLHLVFPTLTALTSQDTLRGIVEGMHLPTYVFTSLKHHSIKDELPALVNKVTFFFLPKTDLPLAEKIGGIFEGVYFARDLVNGNADDVNPDYLKGCRGLAQEFPKVKTTVHDKKWLEKEKMGLILAVNRGSHREPAFIIVEYRGNPKSTDRTVLVGKGITFDTGGLNLKPTGSMETMKADMAGAATVLGTIYAAAEIGLKQNITAVVVATENSIDSHSYKPGDVYKGYSGHTVEIGNTDAEGRLVLADAMAYACDHLKPTRLIDFATLTGAIDIALGYEASGLFVSEEELSEQLVSAGQATHERVWRMPLFEEYRELLKSDIADMRNVAGRSGGSIIAAVFLKEFVDKKIPWAHFDIAATAFWSDAKRYYSKYATGVGVRLMIEFLESIRA